MAAPKEEKYRHQKYPCWRHGPNGESEFCKTAAEAAVLEKKGWKDSPAKHPKADKAKA